MCALRAACVLSIACAMAAGCQVIAGITEYEPGQSTGAGGEASGGGGSGGGSGGAGAAGGGGMLPTDCTDDLLNAGVGEAIWSQRFGDNYGDNVFDVVADDAGDIYIVGGFTGFIFEGEHQLSAGMDIPSGFIAKLDPCGEVVWSKSIGVVNGVQYAYAAAIVDNRLYVLGGHAREFDIDGIDIPFVMGGGAAGTEDIWLAAFDADDGNALWANAYGGPGAESPTSIDAMGSLVVIGGSFSDGAQLGGATLGVPSLNGTEGFILEVDGDTGSSGALAFVEGRDADTVMDVALHDSGVVVAVATFSDTVTSPVAATTTGVTDMLVLRYEPGLTFSGMSHVLVTGVFQLMIPLDVDILDDDVVVGGLLTGQVGTGINTLTPRGADGFVMKYDIELDLSWARTLGGTGDEYDLFELLGGLFGVAPFKADLVTDVAFAPDGSAVFASGSCRGSFELSDGPAACGDQDAFVVRLAASNGGDEWGIFGHGQGDGYPWGLAIADDQVVTGGYFFGTLDFDGVETLTNGSESTEAFVVRIGP